MKLLVFAHTPPPHHGQSYMVQLMLEGFGGDRRKRGRPASDSTRDGNGANVNTTRTDLDIDCYHVNARLSKHLEDIGDFRPAKLLLLVGHCLEAIWVRFRHGVTNFYYVPAPGKRSALYRDWLVMLLCRPFFKRIILHWHAAGLAKWLETARQVRTRAITYRLLKSVDVSIVLSRYNRADAEKLLPRQIKVVSNGIPDPCPHFEAEVLPRRKARFAARKKLLSGEDLTTADLANTGGDPRVFKVLYLAHCTREKGLFDAVNAVLLANRRLTGSRFPLTLQLMVTGNFVTEHERAEFDRILREPDAQKFVRYAGFVSGDQKEAALREADLFCFPTYYQNENQPVNLIEAMAYGLPVLTTRWRSLPELLPSGYPGLVDIRAPEQIAITLLGLLTSETGEAFRQIFVRNFTLESHLVGLAEAFHSAERQEETAVPGAVVPMPST